MPDDEQVQGMSLSKKVLSAVGTLTIMLGLIFGFWRFEDRYATADDLEAQLNLVIAGVAEEVYKLQQSDVEQQKNIEAQGIRIDIIRVEDYRESLQKRVNSLDATYGLGCERCEPAVKMVYDQTLEDIAQLDERLEGLGGTE